MARAVKVRDKDLGWNQIQKEIKKFEGSSVLVGFQEGDVTKREAKGQRIKQGGKTMAAIAAENEFGTKKVPARPFMRTSFDENQTKIRRRIDFEYSKVVDGKQTANVALIQVGQEVVGLIQRKIEQIKTPPNSPETIKLKGSSNPLIDFGQMIQSVREKVIK